MKTVIAFLAVMLLSFSVGSQEDPDIMQGIRGAPCKQPPKIVLTLGLIEESCQANLEDVDPGR